jgi:hypothetical protein
MGRGTFRGAGGDENLKINLIWPYQEEVKNVQMLTDTIYHVWPRPGGKTSTPMIMKFTILVEAFLFYITMHLVFLTFM